MAKAPKFIAIQSCGKRIVISDAKPKSGYILHIKGERVASGTLAEMLFDEVLTPLAQEWWGNERRKDVSFAGACEGPGRTVQFSLFEPDAWYYVIAWIMAQGVMQGLSWEATKVGFNKALAKLRKARLAPLSEHPDAKPAASKHDFGFTWTAFALDEDAQVQMYVAIHTALRKRTPSEKEALLEGAPKQDKKVKSRKEKKKAMPKKQKSKKKRRRK